MAFSTYIQIDGIEGQATDAAHANWIDVIAFKHGSAQQSASHDQANSAGRGVLKPLVFTHALDKATPNLQKACMSGQNIASVKMEVCAQIGGAKAKLYELEMTNARVIGADVATAEGKDGSVRVLEDVSLVAEQVKWTAHTFKTTGELAGDVAAGWNTTTDSAV